jgi:hypothetical protein
VELVRTLGTSLFAPSPPPCRRRSSPPLLPLAQVDANVRDGCTSPAACHGQAPAELTAGRRSPPSLPRRPSSGTCCYLRAWHHLPALYRLKRLSMPVPLSSIGRELGKERSSCRERRGLSGRSSRVAIVGKIMRKRERAGRKPRTVWHVISPVRGHAVRQK